MSTTTQPGARETYALADIEPVLHDMRTATAMLGHMAGSKFEVDSDQLHYIESRLIECHRKLDTLWKQAWEDRKAEHEVHRAALAEANAKAKEAAPGSVGQLRSMEAMLSILRSGHRVALEQAEEMAEGVKAALAEREGQS